MPDIYKYTDYRLFLRDYYAEKRQKMPGYSYAVFSRQAGIKSRGFLHNVIKGKKTISRASAISLAQGMRLNRNESDYFMTLVGFNQATNLKERDFLFEKLNSLAAGRNGKKPKMIRMDQFEFYAQPYHATIRLLILMYGFNGDYQWLARSVYPRITPMQAKKSVQLLERLKMVKRTKRGWKVKDPIISTAREVKNLALLKCHEKNGHLALESLRELPGNQRNISGLSLAVSRKTYEWFCDEIAVFRRRLLLAAEKDEKADAVYRLNLQLFPSTDPNGVSKP